MTATILQMPTCRFDREFILTGETGWTRALDAAESLGAAIHAGQHGSGISGRVTALDAMVAALIATRPADVDTLVYFRSAAGMGIAISLRAAPAYLRAITQ